MTASDTQLIYQEILKEAEEKNIKILLPKDVGPWAWTGVFLTMGGILWVVTEHRPKERIHLPGLGFAALAALCQAAGMVMSREVMINTPITSLWAALVRLASATLRRQIEERRVGKECRSRWSPYH